MNKLLLSLLVVTSSFLMSETYAQSVRCKFHNSNICKDPTAFQSEYKMGCASPSGNCVYKFCKENCLGPRSTADKQTDALCAKHCLDSSLLARFDRKTRETLYKNFYFDPNSEKYLANLNRALVRERQVQEAKRGRWSARFRRTPNTDLLKKLEREKANLQAQMSAAQAAGDRRSAAHLSRVIAVIEQREKAIRQKPAVPPRSPKVMKAIEAARLSRRQSSFDPSRLPPPPASFFDEPVSDEPLPPPPPAAGAGAGAPAEAMVREKVVVAVKLVLQLEASLTVIRMGWVPTSASAGVKLIYPLWLITNKEVLSA